MENENTVRQTPEPEAEAGQQSGGGSSRRRRFYSRDVGRYIRYVVFLVVIGLAYIWNSHSADKQIRRASQLKKELQQAKAEYKTMHARMSAGTRRPVIAEKVDTLGLRISSKNIYKLIRD